ncbi:Axial regulator YABBY 4 [Linum grandiflorum]
MSSTMSNQLFDLPATSGEEQICYVQCGFCTTILLVSVPCNSLSMVVTVRCGHCTSLLSVNMMKSSVLPFHLLPTSPDVGLDHEDRNHQEQKGDDHHQVGSLSEEKGSLLFMDGSPPMLVTSDDNEEEDVNRKINKPPEKRQRAPSAYNCFIKEEIKRLKAENPNMVHKEAFSMAAKNWAQFPPAHFRDEIKLKQQQDHEHPQYTMEPL